MKKFLSENWYKLMIGSSLVMASFGFMIQSITHATAQSPKNSTKIIPSNSEGIITVKLTDEQLKVLTPKEIQKVDLQKVYGWQAAAYSAYKDNDGITHCALGIRVTEP